jgi:hypothetical protein
MALDPTELLISRIAKVPRITLTQAARNSGMKNLRNHQAIRPSEHLESRSSNRLHVQKSWAVAAALNLPTNLLLAQTRALFQRKLKIHQHTCISMCLQAK